MTAKTQDNEHWLGAEDKLGFTGLIGFIVYRAYKVYRAFSVTGCMELLGLRGVDLVHTCFWPSCSLFWGLGILLQSTALRTKGIFSRYNPKKCRYRGSRTHGKSPSLSPCMGGKTMDPRQGGHGC